MDKAAIRLKIRGCPDSRWWKMEITAIEIVIDEDTAISGAILVLYLQKP